MYLMKPAVSMRMVGKDISSSRELDYKPDQVPEPQGIIFEHKSSASVPPRCSSRKGAQNAERLLTSAKAELL